MCIVVDPPLFVPIFKSTDAEHAQFAPVMKWITDGRGKLVYGGSLYKLELSRVRTAIPLLAELQRRGRIVRVPDADVDAAVKQAKEIEPAQDFDDPHLVAIVRVTGCKLICVRDPRSHRFLRSAIFYGSKAARPKLYTRAKNKHLLCDEHICACCR
jgi:hypothetical protein